MSEIDEKDRPATLYANLKEETTIEWVTCKLKDIKDDIERYVSESERYPNAYNQHEWGNHKGRYSKEDLDSKEVTDQKEKMIAKGLFNWHERKKERKEKDTLYMRLKKEFDNCANSIGKIWDYEVPLFHTQKEGGGRKIDIISVPDDKQELYILELKNNQSKETILRCLLEAFTYSLFADRVRLKEAYGASQNAKIVICPLIFKGTRPYKDLMQLNGKAEFKKLLKEMEQVGDVKVKFAVLDANDWGDEKKYTTKFPSDCDGKEFKPEWLWGAK